MCLHAMFVREVACKNILVRPQVKSSQVTHCVKCQSKPALPQLNRLLVLLFISILRQRCFCLYGTHMEVLRNTGSSQELCICLYLAKLFMLGEGGWGVWNIICQVAALFSWCGAWYLCKVHIFHFERFNKLMHGISSIRSTCILLRWHRHFPPFGGLYNLSVDKEVGAKRLFFQFLFF